MRHNDAGVWGVIINDVLKLKKNDRSSKLINCYDLSMNCVLVYYDNNNYLQ